jgi:hypothetical protein
MSVGELDIGPHVAEMRCINIGASSERNLYK